VSLISALLQCNPVDGNESYTTEGSVFVEVSVIPPGIALVLSLPPFAIILGPTEAAELAALLLELVAEIP
jgi:hypothetical protein